MIHARRAFVVDDPYRGDIVAEVPLFDEARAHSIVERAAAAQRDWARRPLEERIAVCHAFVAALDRRSDDVARDITLQMGKPLAQARAEVATCLDRARTLIELAPGALAEERLPAREGLWRRITHEPVGVVLVIAAWNYPLLVAIGPVMASLLAGNAVVLKHAPRTPLCAEHFAQAFAEAGAPLDLVAPLHVDHRVAAQVIEHPAIGFVSFTGSVSGGRQVLLEVASRRFVGVGLELGGNDAAYVAEDADLSVAAAGLVEGATWNAGQSCCAVERVFVHRSLYDSFVEATVRLARELVPGDPLDEGTTLGPMAQPDAPARLRMLVDEARAAGGSLLCGGASIQPGGRGRFFAPTVIADVPAGCSLMRQEVFGPILAIAPVGGDEEALRRMNDGPYGLTASLWTTNRARAERMGARLDVGTVYMNRCDFLDPSLPWSGRRQSGRGISLSHLGFLPVTRPKSWNFLSG